MLAANNAPKFEQSELDAMDALREQLLSASITKTELKVAQLQLQASIQKTAEETDLWLQTSVACTAVAFVACVFSILRLVRKSKRKPEEIEISAKESIVTEDLEY